MLLLDEPNLPVSNVRKIGPEGRTLIARLVEVDAAMRDCVTSDVHDHERDPEQLFRDTALISALFVTDAGELYFQTESLFARLTR